MKAPCHFDFGKSVVAFFAIFLLLHQSVFAAEASSEVEEIAEFPVATVFGKKTDAPEVLRLEERYMSALDGFAAYRADGKRTLAALFQIVEEARFHVPRSRESSALLVAASRSYAWFEFRFGSRKKAESELAEIFNLISEPTGFDAYPESFRDFAERIRSRGRMASDSVLSLRSKPPGARVYVDGVLIGTTPLQTVLQEGRYQAVFEATGRRPLLKEFALASGKSLGLKVSLPRLEVGSSQHHSEPALPRERGGGVSVMKKPAFWAIAGGLVIAGVIVGVLAGQGGSSGPETGGLIVGF